jgi:hypothetical protein
VIIQNATVPGKDSASNRILLNTLFCVNSAFRLIGKEIQPEIIILNCITTPCLPKVITHKSLVIGGFEHLNYILVKTLHAI